MVHLKTYKSFIIFTWLLIILWPAFAQEPWFKTLTLPGKFNNCEIHKMIVDDKDMMWLGTTCGLIRYDGYTYQNLSKIEDEVTALNKNAKGDLLISFKQNPPLRYNGISFETLKFHPAVTDGKISSMAQSQTGPLWFSQQGKGVAYLRNDSLHFINTQNSALADDYIYEMLADQNGLIWVASDAGINIIELKGENPKIHFLGPGDGLPDVMILNLSMDEHGYIWAGAYEGGFCRIDPDKLKVNFTTAGKSWAYGSITGIIPAENQLWISTGNSGIFKYDLKDNKVYPYELFGKLRIKHFSGALNDQEGNLWFNSGNTLIQIPGVQFEFIKGTEANGLRNVHALMTDQDGYLWYAAESGLFKHAPNFGESSFSQEITLPASLSSRDITCLHQDKFANVWIGTFGKGLYRINKNGHAGTFFTEENGFINNNILSITSTENELWFATLGGASKYKYKNENSTDPGFENFDKSHGPGNNFIYCVYHDRKNRVWFATDGTGITVLEDGNFKHFGLKEGLSSERIYTITEDDEGKIWCATSDNSIFSFEGDHFSKLNPWLNNEFNISALKADGENRLLIVQENGLNIFDITTGNSNFYGENYGIAPIDPEFNLTSNLWEGSIWIGTNNGIIKYSPQPPARISSPRPLITSVQKLNENIDPTRISTFGHQQNYFSIKYVGLWYQHPEAVSYRVKLEGNDLEWVYTAEREARYSKLAPGKYTFRLQATHNGNFDQCREVQYSFIISKPFWVTIWFYLLVTITIGLSTFAYIRLRLQRLRKIESLEREKILIELQTLRSQVNPHFLFNSFSTLMSAIEEDKKLALDYVERLSAFFRNILEVRDKDLVSLGEEVLLVENYVSLQQSRFGENLIVIININEKHLQTRIPPMTIQLLIENAIKHNIISKSKPLSISITSQKNYVRIENKLQRKNHVPDSTGFGLSSIRNRYRLLGEMEVEVFCEEDSFVILLPFIKT